LPNHLIAIAFEPPTNADERLSSGGWDMRVMDGPRREDRAMTTRLELDELDDRELVARARAGDDRTIEVLLRRFRSFARSKARSYFLVGSEREDVVQEGMIGLYKAIRDFDLHQEAPFWAFAELCISRQILTAIKTANRNKHRPLNSSVSLDAPFYEEEEGTTVGDRVPGVEAASDPERLVISAEEVAALKSSMRRNMTQLEGDVLALYMEGKSYEEIAGMLGNHVKSIDNALQRVKRKLQRHLNARDELSS
jgi:RNA polymerase sporulation-specific sigma factor